MLKPLPDGLTILKRGLAASALISASRLVGVGAGAAGVIGQRGCFGSLMRHPIPAAARSAAFVRAAHRVHPRLSALALVAASQGGLPAIFKSADAVGQHLQYSTLVTRIVVIAYRLTISARELEATKFFTSHKVGLPRHFSRLRVDIMHHRGQRLKLTATLGPWSQLLSLAASSAACCAFIVSSTHSLYFPERSLKLTAGADDGDPGADNCAALVMA